MRVATVHYHLRPGGVSTVIRVAVGALAAEGVRQVVLVGEDGGELPGGSVPVRVIDGLGYGGALAGGVAGWVGQMRTVAGAALGGPPDVWHFHNHALGKNPLMDQIVAYLTRCGERLVLQTHDFVEDGRPENYENLTEKDKLYPFGPGICHVCVNRRDLGRLVRHGLPESCGAWLPNVTAWDAGVGWVEAGWTPLVLYPVRGIRRKNLGELVLLAALAGGGARFAVTRAPLDGAALAVHDGWWKLARECRLAVEFAVVGRERPVAGAGSGLGLGDWLAHASHIVSTSVEEGFGQVFVDAVAGGYPLMGRSLPHLEGDLAAVGIRHRGMYRRLEVPVAWVGVDVLARRLAEVLPVWAGAYGRRVESDGVERALGAMVRDGWVDFGNLPEDLQCGVVRRVVEAGGGGEVVAESDGQRVAARAWLAGRLAERRVASPGNPADLAQTPWRDAGAYGRRLLGIYQRLMAGGGGGCAGHVDAGGILDECLDPAQFHFLRGASPGIKF